MLKNVGKVTHTGIKCYGIPPNKSRVVPCGWADRHTDGQTDWWMDTQTDMTNLIVSLHDCFGKAPKRD